MPLRRRGDLKKELIVEITWFSEEEQELLKLRLEHALSIAEIAVVLMKDEATTLHLYDMAMGKFKPLMEKAT